MTKPKTKQSVQNSGAKPASKTTIQKTRNSNQTKKARLITLLRRIREENNLKADTLGQLDDSIANLEKHYFLDEKNEEPDLKGIAEGWIEKAA